MSTKLRTIFALIAALGLAGFLGCSAFMDIFTPAYIDPAAAEYADANSTSFFPFTTLWDARRIEHKMAYMYEINQVAISRLGEDNTMKYNFLKDVMSLHIKSAEEFQGAVFNPEGPLGLLIPAAFGTTIGALLIPRPGDKKRITELEKANGNNKTTTA